MFFIFLELPAPTPTGRSHSMVTTANRHRALHRRGYGPTDVSDADEVRLVVPARPEFLRLARVTAAGLAGRLGFSYDEIEDLRLAIDELCFGLTGPTRRPGTVAPRC